MEKFQSKFDKTIVIKDFRNTAVERFNRAKEIFDFSKLKHMSFVNGGEPLKTDTHLLYLRELEKIDHLKNVSLDYITNGSIKPCDEAVSLWRKAKEVNFNVSVDGIYEHFNYHRWPLNFNHVEANYIFH